MSGLWRTLSPTVGRCVNRIPPSFALGSNLNLRAMSTNVLDSGEAGEQLKTSNFPGIDIDPAANQRIFHDGKQYTTVKEGLAYILIPASASTVPQTAPKGENRPQSVFYNPIQQFNRDLSVLAIKAYGEDTVARKKAAKERRLQNIHAKKTKKRKRGEKDQGDDGQNEASKVEDVGGNEDQTMTDTIIEAPAIAPKASVSVIKVIEPARNEKEVAQEATTSETTPDVQTTPSHPATKSKATTNGSDSYHPKPSQPPSFRILDALSATGLRALRYAKEIPFTTSVTANDLLKAATASIDLNLKHNKVSDIVTSVTGNALAHMYSLAVEDPEPHARYKPSQKYDVIDLDPYGTAAPFLDAAVQSVQDGGLLCVTCTDAGVWASNGYPEKCYSLYGGLPAKGMHSHEAGLRLILHAIATSAARYGLAIEPLLSLSIDFYARVFVKIHKSAAEVKFLAGKTMTVYNCDQGCGAWKMQLLARNKLTPNKNGTGSFYKHVFSQGPNTSEHCEHCGLKTHIAGPMYAGPLHSPQFIQKILDDLPNVSKETYQTTERIEGMLMMALEETIFPLEEDSNFQALARKEESYDPAEVDYHPFFFIPSVLSKVIHCQTPHENALRGALRHLGYRVTRSHTKAGSIKTDAPWTIIWEVMREWTIQKSPVREGAIREGTAGWKIMGLDGKKDEEVEQCPKIVFDEILGKEKDKKRLVRYQRNPRENWGPMNRAKGV